MILVEEFMGGKDALLGGKGERRELQSEYISAATSAQARYELKCSIHDLDIQSNLFVGFSATTLTIGSQVICLQRVWRVWVPDAIGASYTHQI